MTMSGDRRSRFPFGWKNVIQLLLVLIFLAIWQYSPDIGALRNHSHVFDPLFISSPSLIAHRLYELTTGANGSPTVWQYLWPTLWASLMGMVIGMVLGAVSGLLLSNWTGLSDVLRPFVVAANAVPRIALIPIIVILVGPSFTASVIICVLVVFFVTFFNAYEGGRTVADHLLQNAALLGAGRWQIMLYIRLPYVTAWSLASLPAAATFAVISVITGELLVGNQGLGGLLETASVSIDATLTFSIVIILALLGALMVLVAEIMKRRILHWWESGG